MRYVAQDLRQLTRAELAGSTGAVTQVAETYPLTLIGVWILRHGLQTNMLSPAVFFSAPRYPLPPASFSAAGDRMRRHIAVMPNTGPGTRKANAQFQPTTSKTLGISRIESSVSKKPIAV